MLQEVDDLADAGEGHADAGVGCAIVDADLVALGECCAGEDHVGHIASQLVRCGGSEEIVHAAVQDTAGIGEVEQGCSHRIAVTVAGADDTVVEQQPALIGADRYAASTDFEALPRALFKGRGGHHQAMFAPVFHVGGVTEVDVAKGGVSVVGWAREHAVTATYLFGEKYAVAVERQKGVLALIERLEVGGVGYADSRHALIAVAPCYPVAVFYPAAAWVIFVGRFDHVGVAAYEGDGLVVDVPVYAVAGEASKDVHLHATVVAAKDTRKAFAERHDGGIEDGVGRGDGVALDNRVCAVSPDDIVGVGRAFLPRDVLRHHDCGMEIGVNIVCRVAKLHQSDDTAKPQAK